YPFVKSLCRRRRVTAPRHCSNPPTHGPSPLSSPGVQQYADCQFGKGKCAKSFGGSWPAAATAVGAALKRRSMGCNERYATRAVQVPRSEEHTSELQSRFDL